MKDDMRTFMTFVFGFGIGVIDYALRINSGDRPALALAHVQDDTCWIFFVLIVFYLITGFPSYKR